MLFGFGYAFIGEITADVGTLFGVFGLAVMIGGVGLSIGELMAIGPPPGTTGPMKPGSTESSAWGTQTPP
ncbi:hypothetical protein GCM10017559_53360 [Streptosporangium longisporum]|uniref:Major facilitator superfamily (MFS) profile domain-containing protein n=1 Tax=Streptosporangium longisporum TaxID=46187 RepID=A0ABP6KUK3_9ACTN